MTDLPTAEQPGVTDCTGNITWVERHHSTCRSEEAAETIKLLNDVKKQVDRLLHNHATYGFFGLHWEIQALLGSACAAIGSLALVREHDAALGAMKSFKEAQARPKTEKK